MRIFWAVIIGVVIAAIVLAVAPEDAPSSTPTAPARPVAPVAPVDVEPPSDDPPPKTWILKDGETLAAIAEMRYGAAHHWPRIVQANPKLASGELELGDEIVLPDLEDLPLQDSSSLVADLDGGRSERETTEAPPDRIPVPEDAPRLSIGLDREIPEATVVPGTLVRIDGDIVADGRFRISGEGTQASPYRVTWELLSSGASSYRPSLGEREIPQRLAMLDGAWVEIEGYVAFPLGGSDTTELLAMLNQWDGCCIGIPPTPYDAIEVALTDAIAPAARHAISYGSLTGRLLVSPYLVENWLVGLYLMDDATVRFEL